jgi:hypothetical protein
LSSGMLHRVVWLKRTDVSDEPATSIQDGDKPKCSPRQQEIPQTLRKNIYIFFGVVNKTEFPVNATKPSLVS